MKKTQDTPHPEIKQLFHIYRTLQPKTLEEYLNGYQMLDSSKVLLQVHHEPSMPSIILYGPPGCGKRMVSYYLIKKRGGLFNHVLLNKNKEIVGKSLNEILNQAIKQYRQSRQSIILFVDKLELCSKSMQEVLLAAVKKGFISLIATTAKDPSQEIIPSLVEQCLLIKLRKHTNEELQQSLHSALTNKKGGLARLAIKIEPDAEELLIRSSNGNLKTMLKLLESELRRQYLIPMGNERKNCDKKAHKILQFHITKTGLTALLNEKKSHSHNPG